MHAQSAPSKTKIHGKSKTPEYRAWRHIKDRVFNPSCKAYSDYGGRGIGMCERWETDFTAFYEDMGERPSRAHSIDRIDVNGDYEPANCRWTLKNIQQQNTRLNRNNTTGYKGVYLWKSDNRAKKWLARIGDRKIGYYYSAEDAAEAYNDAAVRIYGENAAVNQISVTA